MNKNDLFSILLFTLVVICNDVIASTQCNDVESKSTMLQLKRNLLCEYDPEVRPVQNNNNKTRVTFRMIPHFLRYVSICENLFVSVKIHFYIKNNIFL